MTFTRRLRVAFIVHSFPCVSETFILTQITGLLDLGHSIDVFTVSSSQEGPVHQDFYRYKLQERTFCLADMPARWPMRAARAGYLILKKFRGNAGVITRALNIFRYGRKAASLRMLFNALCFTERGEYDIVHVHFGMNGFLALDMLSIRALTGKLIVSFHGYDVNVWPRIKGERCYDTLFKRADLLTVSSQFIADRLVRLGAEPGKVLRLPVGVDVTDFSYRESSAVSPVVPIVVTVSRLVEVKGIEYSLRAFQKVSLRFPQACYLIIGDGPLRASLETLCKELGISRRVRFLGALTRSDVARILRLAHIFVLAGVVGANGAEEGQGVVLLEAQAVGLPVVATLVGGIPESVANGRSGFLVPARDPDALAERLCFLMDHPQLWRDMGRSGRRHVEANFSLQRLNEMWVETYQQLL